MSPSNVDPSEPPDPLRAERIWSLLEANEVEANETPCEWPSIPGYRLVAVIGEGGSATVYRGFRDGSAAPVAVKVMRRTEVTETGQQRAWRELEILSRLRSPSVPRVLDYGLHGGQLFIVTDLVEGDRLDQCERIRRAPLRERVELLASIAAVVQGIHEYGVIHRDLKPANILLDTANRPVIIDFGIALLHEDAPTHRTETGVPVGSPAFMSPEQARGERNRISTRTDVYGLGAIGYELLTGETPHRQGGALHEAIRAVAQDPARDPRGIEPSLPRPLSAILAKAVECDPTRRYATADELADDLWRWLAGETIHAAPPTVWRRTVRWIARHPIATTTLACLAIASMFLAATETAIWWLARRPSHMMIGPDRSWAALLSAGGSELRRWPGENPEDIVVAYLTDPAPGLGGSRFVVFAAQPGADLPSPGDLCFFAADDPTTPYWTSAGTITLPAKLRDAAPVDPDLDRFRVRWAASWDVFPDRPGDEVVAVHCHVPYSPMVIRVYSATGAVLFEAWHDGELNAGYWMADAGLLVLTGANSDGKWAQRGGGATRGGYPRVVLAVEPELGRTHELLSWEGFEGTMAPAWYLCVLPPRINDLIIEPETRVEMPTLKYAPGRTVMLSIRALSPVESGFRWVIDEKGRVLESFPVQGWNDDHSLPRKDEMRLGPLPPRQGEASGDAAH